MFGSGKRPQSGWRSTKAKAPAQRPLGAAFDAGSDHVREQVRTVFASETGRLLVLGDILLEAAVTPIGRIVVAAAALTGAWALL